MWLVLRKLVLGGVLIAASSAVLLFSDLGNRKVGTRRLPRLAVVLYAPHPALDAVLRGVLDGLAAAGHIAGRDYRVRVFNGQNDMATVSQIARAVTDGSYDLVITGSTPCLQAVAEANVTGRTKHVFTAVTDPVGAGVGINPADPTDHPPHLVGIGSFEPVASLFRLVKEKVRPSLKRVGAVYSTEECAEACLAKARKACAELGIELVPVRVENSSGVYEAGAALVNRRVEAIWVGGDNTVESAVASLVRAAQRGGVPVLMHTPDKIEEGALLCLGADYYDIGVLTGELVARVLSGADMAKMPVKDLVPEFLAVNLRTAAGLKPEWKIPPDVLRRADLVVDVNGKLEKRSRDGERTTGKGAPKLGRKWKLFFVKYVDTGPADTGVKGILDELKAAGLAPGRDFTATVKSGQGDVAALRSIMDLARAEKADMVLPICTPALQAALRRFDKTPIVYAIVASGVLAGAGRSAKDHRPNVTGADIVLASDEMADILRRCLPRARRVGTVFAPGEVNSVYSKDLLKQSLERKGIELVAAPANTPSEVVESLMSLNGRDIQALCQISDNLSDSCYASYMQVAKRTNLPVFAFLSRFAERGAVVVAASDFYANARDAGRLAARIMRGESPADMPFKRVAKADLIINMRQAKRYGVRIPESLRKRAKKVID